MYSEVIAVLHYNNYDADNHACVLKACISSKYSKCISAIKRILHTTAMYISSSSFVYLCFSLYCDACLKCSVLRVGVKTLHNTIIIKLSSMLERAAIRALEQQQEEEEDGEIRMFAAAKKKMLKLRKEKEHQLFK